MDAGSARKQANYVNSHNVNFDKMFSFIYGKINDVSKLGAYSTSVCHADFNLSEVTFRYAMPLLATNLKDRGFITELHGNFMNISWELAI